MRHKRAIPHPALLLALLVAAAIPGSGIPAQAVTAPVARDITHSSGLWLGQPVPREDRFRQWYGTYPYDVDGDGDLDVLLAPHGHIAYLMMNDGTGHFTERAPGTIANLDDRHGCAWGDVDDNGWPDLYCARGGWRGRDKKRNALWLQKPDGTFVERAQQYEVLDIWGRGREPAFIDVNHDPWPDLYLTNEYPRKDGHETPNRLFINVNGNYFRDAPEYGVDVLGGETWGVHSCVHSVDFDLDGWQDLLVCGRPGLHLYRNVNGTRFEDVTGERGIESALWHDAQMVDVNGDGRPDLVGVTTRGFRVQLAVRGRFRRTVAIRFDDGRQVAVGDVNGDGRADVYVVRGNYKSNHNAPDRLYLNDGTGEAFSETPVPEVGNGAGDSVSTGDLTGDGVPEFIVTNGYNLRNGVQLLTFR